MEENSTPQGQPEEQSVPVSTPMQDVTAPQATPTVTTTPPVTPVTPPAAASAQAPLQATDQDPGHGLGIASLVCSLLGISLVGLILGIIAMKKSKEVGRSNGLALAGVIISSIGMVLSILWLIFVVILAVSGNTSSSY